MTLCDAAVAVLSTAAPADKLRFTEQAAAAWSSGAIDSIGTARPPARPARPERPAILPPNRMPRRGIGGTAGKIALLHALAHIEFNAIDLAWDIVARFTNHQMPRAYYDDWVTVALEEARHFQSLEQALNGLGATYGAEPAHDGLWDAAAKTAHDLRERLAVVPMTLEARALDTAPNTIRRLADAGDTATAAILQRIFADEISHVAAGVRWFETLCRAAGEDPTTAYQRIAQYHFTKGLKAPFNLEARMQAGYPPVYYQSLARPR